MVKVVVRSCKVAEKLGYDMRLKVFRGTLDG
jgi:hypothetical protein